MPITKEFDGRIAYIQKRDLWSSDVTGVFSDQDVAISSDVDPTKQIKFNADPLSGDTALTLQAGAAASNITITFPNTSGTLALDGSGPGVGFETIQTPAGTSPVATGASDVLTLAVSGGGITITGNATTDTVTYALDSSVARIATTLTNSRVTFANASGQLTDNSRLTYVSGQLSSVNGGSLSAPYSANPDRDILVETFPIIQWGQDPNIAYNGVPLCLFWDGIAQELQFCTTDQTSLLSVRGSGINANDGNYNNLTAISNLAASYVPANRVFFAASSGVLSSSSLLLWDVTNSVMSVGTTALTTSRRLTVRGSGSTSATFSGRFENFAGSVGLAVRDDQRVGIANDPLGTARLYVVDSNSLTTGSPQAINVVQNHTAGVTSGFPTAFSSLANALSGANTITFMQGFGIQVRTDSQSGTITNYQGADISARHTGSTALNIINFNGLSVDSQIESSTGSGTISNMRALQAVISSTSGTLVSATTVEVMRIAATLPHGGCTTYRGLSIEAPTSTVTPTTATSLQVAVPTVGTTRFSVNLLGAAGTTADGITWNSETTTNLWREAAARLRTSGSLSISQRLQTRTLVDSTSTGSLLALSLTGTSFLQLSNTTGAITIQGMAGGGLDGHIVTIVNRTTFNLTINNEDLAATAANRVLTGTGAAITIPNNGAFLAIYNTTTSRWYAIGKY